MLLIGRCHPLEWFKEEMREVQMREYGGVRMIYVTSDLHGISLQRLRSLLAQAKFSEDDTLFVLGDTVDRGEQGVELLLWMMEQFNVIHLLGNHEDMLLNVSDMLFDTITEESLERITDDKMDTLSTMIANGAQPTLTALKRLYKRDPEQIQALVEYLKEMSLFEALEVNDVTYVLVHAGLGNFDRAKRLSAYTKDELLWHRPESTDRYFGGDVMVLFGHTPTSYYGTEGKLFQTESWCCIDTSDVEPILLRLDDWTVFQEHKRTTGYEKEVEL